MNRVKHGRVAYRPITTGAYGEGPRPLIDRRHYQEENIGLYGIHLKNTVGYAVRGIEFAGMSRAPDCASYPIYAPVPFISRIDLPALPHRGVGQQGHLVLRPVASGGRENSGFIVRLASGRMSHHDLLSHRRRV